MMIRLIKGFSYGLLGGTVVGVILALLMSITAGCTHPPRTIPFDLDGDGAPDILAVDADGDYIPDLDANGQPILVEGTEHYGMTYKVDTAIPSLLTILGGLTGIGWLGGAGILWNRVKVGRVVSNLIAGIQAARQKIAEDGPEGLLEQIDETLDVVETKETKKVVSNVKDKEGFVSATDKVLE